MEAKGIETEFAERVFEQIRGFGEYGFPESHAASFALIAYATAWMRRHYPDVFACSLLNAQPMGFYSAATIVEDAKRHGVRILPIDVRRSDWDCTLEKKGSGTFFEEESPGHFTPALLKKVPDPFFSVRMGLRYVKGLGEGDWERIDEARAAAPFGSIDDFVARTRPAHGTVARLAEAGAFAGLEPNRRGALWAATGASRAPGTPMPLRHDEAQPDFSALDAFETIGWDYRTTGHSTNGHPLEPLRERMRLRRLPEARAVTAQGDGRRVQYAGLVICRQRPGTASGVVFLTLEDETGFVNVVCWSQVYEQHRVLVKTASFLGVTGRLQIQDGVAHLIAERFWSPRDLLAAAPARSRDFH